ncbi:MAG: type I DNA topoisomerase [Caldilineaceae bacterium SB0675_bin_29]|uniref:DNA topoisomerase 1 n=1 Tax=Caldilineaceae bacterium SB0675_bin_29 TaxID=2605266 RepID=A0A6B1FY15_9CHLR|nr:type I DNA topoisomerase [Caldilineaceae bacterium SB0675_bin_29]
MSKLVIVESPTKARTIRGFLPSGYEVKASMGHVRDLPASAAEVPAKVKGEPWARLGVKVEDAFEPLYVVPSDKKKVVSELRSALKGADEVLLATDEDREGESIGWHLFEVLKPKVPVRRMIFHEITREAIEQALKTTRSIDNDLVRAQETRRILDRLVGYTISPLLWKKIAPKLSAGRVQSAAVRLLVLRERERRAFMSGSYWDLKAQLNKRPDSAAHRFEATLVSVNGTRVATGRDFDESTGKIAAGKRVKTHPSEGSGDVLLLDEEQARALQQRLQDSTKSSEQSRSPAPPFTTSTLQQEANRKNRWGARHTMRVAQSLYENGYITYMRTDSVHLSDEAVNAARRRVQERYGERYLIEKPRRYRTKSKGAQEAHEAIRPAGNAMRPLETLPLSGDEATLYDMIWKRTVATQMANARLRTTTVMIRATGQSERGAADEALFRASGREILFPGYFRAYVEGSDDPDAAIENQESPLPALAKDEGVDCRELEAVGHATKPPARYTEATLVRALETEGIGRPSTYATIIDTVQNRGYVFKQRQELVPTFVAFAVVQLLESNFEELVDLKFTAEMEQTLDDIAEGEVDWLEYLNQFYLSEQGLESQVREKENAIDPRHAGRVDFPDLPVEVRIGQFGPFLAKEVNGDRQTVSLPDDLAPGDLDAAAAEALVSAKQDGPIVLGKDPVSGQPVLVKDGRFGAYVQLGEDGARVEKPRTPPGPVDINTATARELATLPGIGPGLAKGIIAGRPYASAAELERVPRLSAKGVEKLRPLVVAGKGKPKAADAPAEKAKSRSEGKPKRASLLEGMTIEGMDLETALQLLSLPRDLGTHPEDGEAVRAGVGRYGPYVVHNRKFVSLKAPDNVLEVDLPRALALIKEAPTQRGRSSTRTILKELGAHPNDGEPVRVLDGRYGPYVNHNSTNANIPKETDPQSVSLEQAVQMLAEREKSGKGRGRGGRRRRR